MNSKEIKQLIGLLVSATNNSTLFVGVTAKILLSKQIFKKNIDLSIFIQEIFDISFLNYVIRSRTLILARVIKHINQLNDKETTKLAIKMHNYLIKQGISDTNKEKEKEKEKEKKVKNKKNNTLDFMDKWIFGIMSQKDENIK